MSELEALRSAYSQGQVNRIAFIERARAIGVSSHAAEAWIGEMDATKPRKGGVLRFGNSGGSGSDNLNPRTITDGVAGIAAYATYNLLVEIDDNGKAVPELAESWSSNADATQWLVDIRKGVTFHNGKTLIAEDVVYSLNLHRGKEISGAKGIVAGIREIKAAGKNRIEISLDQPNADFAYVLSDYHLMIVPDGWKDWTRPIGTGAYVLDYFEPGVRGAGDRNLDYWKQGRGHADRYEIEVINDFEKRLAALASGEFDLMNRVERNRVDFIKKHYPQLTVTRAPGGQNFVILMMCDRPPFDNADVRRALKYAIDRKEIVDTVLNGYGTVGNDHPIPHYDRYFHSELPLRPYDPDKSRHYLKKAGLDGLSVELATSSAAFTEAPATADLYSRQAKRAGIDVKVARRKFEGYWDDVWMKEPFCMSFWGGRPTADMMLSAIYESNADWNDTHWHAPDFGKFLLEARRTRNEEKRRAIYWRLQEMVHEDGGYIVPMFADFVDCINKRIRGLSPSPAFELSSLRAAERCWIDG